ncbi:MAG: uracil phosphoribosyltransferase [Ruminococcus sp.]|jgi:uracil phosphoribosyltransferase|nr:uracil phosphoribosyltransferase [Ruminococcus sp.]
MINVKLIEHPLVQHKISLLRDVNTGAKEFRELASETAMLMCYEATRDLPLKTVEVETPIGSAKSKVISGRKIAFVPILRAGLGMLDGALALVPAAKVGHIGLYRDAETKNVVDYYCKLPFDVAEREVIVLDIMLATGGSACRAIDLVKKAGVKMIKYMCIIAVPEGISAINETHPDVPVYCAAIDEKLNSEAFIVPGLGDAGDRMFGTK